MPYLTAASEIKSLISTFAQRKTLWADTEVADYNTKKPRLSLIQVSDDPTDLTGAQTYILDVLDRPDLAAAFTDQIMANPDIEKVFHNASYDIKFLGKTKAKNVTCTLEMAKKIPYYLLPLPNLKLKTIAEKLCNFPNPDKEEQGSDWGKRPLSEKQLKYAHMDTVYLAQAHRRLLELISRCSPDPATENLTALTQRYHEIAEHWKLLDSEISAIQERIKKAMQAQKLTETPHFKLASYDRTTVKTDFSELAKLVLTTGIKFDFPVTLTQALQKDLGEAISQLDVQVEKTPTWRLTVKAQEADAEDEGSRLF
jgi:ribonuclease D